MGNVHFREKKSLQPTYILRRLKLLESISMSLFSFLMEKFNQNEIKINFQSSEVCTKKYQSSQISIFFFIMETKNI
jgi:hypothetical protein